MKQLFNKSILLATLLLFSLNGCIGETCTLPNTPVVEDVDKTILLRITQSPPVTRGVSRPIPDGELLEFNHGDLYLVNSIGVVVRHFQITPISGAATNLAAGIINISEFVFDTATNTDVLTLNVNVPSNTTYVYIIGNTSGNSNTGRINSIIGENINIISQYNAWNVNLFGRTIDRLVHTSGEYATNGNRIYRGEMYLAPTVARFEIAEIRGSGNIAEFRVAGIFMDNFVREARINGELITNTLWTGGASSAGFALNGGGGSFVNNPTQTPTSGGTLFDLPNLPNIPPSLGVRPQGSSVTWTDRHGVMRTRPLLWSYQVFAPSSRTTTTLTAAQQPRIIIRLSDIKLIDGTEITGYRYITVRDFVDDGTVFSGIQAGEVYHIAAVVFDDTDLEPLPNLQEPVEDPRALITSFVRVLYDFQQQRLETWPTSGTPVAWKWHVSTSQDGLFTPIPNATSDYWLLPVDFIHDLVFSNINTLYFRTVITLDDGTRITQTPANTLPIRFIRTTNTATGGLSDFRPGFGITPDGTRYAVLNRARHNNVATNPNTIRVALLNLGAERVGNGNEYTGGLGDLFQWGRRADGHEVIGWFNDPATGTTTFTGTGNDAERRGTSPSAPRSGTFSTSGANRGQPTPVRSTFYTAALGDGQWGVTGTTHTQTGNHWGAGATAATQAGRPTRANTPLTIAGWVLQDNNPCRALGDNWRVPSHFDWVDIRLPGGTGGDAATGGGAGHTGTNHDPANVNFPVEDNNNRWYWYRREAGSVGGMIVTNLNTGATVFLPAAGARRGHLADATIHSLSPPTALDFGQGGFYWTSTQNSTRAALHLTFGPNQLWLPRPPNNAAGADRTRYRAHGLSVRCVW